MLATDALELVVAVVLIALGVRGLVQAARSGRSGGQTFTHAHGGHAHAHAGVRDHLHVQLVDARAAAVRRRPRARPRGQRRARGARRLARRLPGFAIGFIAIYAIGAAVGMATLAGVLGWPLARLARAPRFGPVLVGVSAVASLVVGVAWATPILLRFAA